MFVCNVLLERCALGGNTHINICGKYVVGVTHVYLATIT